MHDDNVLAQEVFHLGSLQVSYLEGPLLRKLAIAHAQGRVFIRRLRTFPRSREELGVAGSCSRI